MSSVSRFRLSAGLAVLASAAVVILSSCWMETAAKSRAGAAAKNREAAAEPADSDAHSSATESTPAWTPPAEPATPKTGADAKPQWAEPVKLAGVGNCYKVSDSLYRGEQPSPEGFRELKKLGIKTVVNLRGLHSDKDEIKESGVQGLAAEHIRFHTWHAEDEDVIKFLKIAGDPARAPVFVHCMHGSDRTGLMCAIYRVAVQGWEKDQALEEMTKGPYGFHSIWKNLPKYFKELDVEKLRKEAGISRP